MKQSQLLLFVQYVLEHAASLQNSHLLPVRGSLSCAWVALQLQCPCVSADFFAYWAIHPLLFVKSAVAITAGERLVFFTLPDRMHFLAPHKTLQIEYRFP